MLRWWKWTLGQRALGWTEPLLGKSEDEWALHRGDGAIITVRDVCKANAIWSFQSERLVK